MMSFGSNCGNKINVGETRYGKCGEDLGSSINNNIGNDNLNIDATNNKKDEDFDRVKESKRYARISLFFAILPIILMIFTVVFFVFSIRGTGNIISLIFAMTFLAVAVLMLVFSGGLSTICALIFGIMSLSRRKNALAIISIIISVIQYFIVFVPVIKMFE